MDVVEMVRMVVGIFLVIYGLGVSAYQEFHDVKYSDQHNGVINGIFCVVAGILCCATTIQRGVIIGVIAIPLWGLEQIILDKIKASNRHINKIEK